MRLDSIEVVTLFIDNIDDAKAFYKRVFAPEIVYEDEVSAVLKFSGALINLLKSTEAPELVAPSAVAAPGSGSRFLLTIKVNDVDAVCADLRGLGVPLLNGPIDRPWGRRTAAFADPSGHIWEIAHDLG